MTAAPTAPEINVDGFVRGVNRKFLPYLIAGGRPACTTLGDYRYLVLMGGAGSGKSRFAAQDVVLRCMTEAGHRFLVIRKVGATLRTSCFQEVKDVIDRLGWHSHVRISEDKMVIRFKISGSVIWFQGLDSEEKKKSLASPTSAWIEEPTELTEQEFNQINIRVRGLFRYTKRVTLSFNPIDENHWLKRRFWDTPDPNGRARIVHSTYRDNRFLPAEDGAELESYRDIDQTFYNVYALGQWGVFKGLIYAMWPTCDRWPADFHDRIYGLDFGFNKPAALIELGERDADWYATQKIYEAGLTTHALGKRMEELGVSKLAPIYCDSAEPDRIEELCAMGFNCHKADKAVQAGILTVKSKRVYTSPFNVDLNRELVTYKWRVDKNGEKLEEPVKICDHILDAARYALHTHCGRAGAFIGGGLDVAPGEY